MDYPSFMRVTAVLLVLFLGAGCQPALDVSTPTPGLSNLSTPFVDATAAPSLSSLPTLTTTTSPATPSASPTNSVAPLASPSLPVSTAENPPTILAETATPVSSYSYISLGPLNSIRYLNHITWEQEGLSLIYAMENEGLELDFPTIEAKDWLWWRYDLPTGVIESLSPPESQVSTTTRERLGICPLEEAWRSPSCPGFSAVIESPYGGERIVFIPPIGGDGETWLANRDGSNAIRLRDSEGLLGIASYFEWSSDGKWVVVGLYTYGRSDERLHFLAATDGTFIGRLDYLTGHSHMLVQGLFPKFSPDGQQLAYVGTDVISSLDQADYGLYTLDLNSLTSRLITKRVGLFQWSAHSQGLFVLSNALNPIERLPNAESLAGRESNLYYIDISYEEPVEQFIAGSIPYFPHDGPASTLWVYSPTTQAIAYIGYKKEQELGILLLNPSP
jgi:hypothetical protein